MVRTLQSYTLFTVISLVIVQHADNNSLLLCSISVTVYKQWLHEPNEQMSSLQSPWQTPTIGIELTTNIALSKFMLNSKWCIQ